MQTGGGAYAWYVDHFCYEEKQIAKNHGQSVYQILEELLAESQVGSNGLIFLPYLIGERSPRWNPNVRGCFVGIRMEHTQKDFLRAVQEGVAMNLNEVLKIFREAEQKIEEIIVVGGGIKSVAWQQILADVYQERIRIPKLLDEATSMGAAITGGVGVGLFADFSVVDKFVSIARDVHPNPDNAEKYDALVMVDESHSAGVAGPTGRGVAEQYNVYGKIDIFTGTLGKAFGGAMGGFTTGKKEIIDMLRQRSRPYLFSNSVAPAIVGASLEMFKILKESDALHTKLMNNVSYFRDKMLAAGFDIKPTQSAICAVMLYDAKLSQDFAAKMQEEGIYVTGFYYPVVPKDQARIRVQLSAGHEKEHLDKAIAAFIKVGKELNVIK